ncbi:hypothetical protein BBK36DRAFT_1195331 [Trichoderma citrinoviride]|uniref:Uncharacterized protein n=1 Tax=Trichoderma citrinoviride TaxID=58853 RepID=A0A2T4BG09_9HYPO|nr:hypothetical protein BBK36DRAFT_1195331 [Trichoderma citrinoviride]PTB68242.1 hypothetical protein BBK36DRAFT_1195331 [Trichoderma citrinoviride]
MAHGKGLVGAGLAVEESARYKPRRYQPCPPCPGPQDWADVCAAMHARGETYLLYPRACTLIRTRPLPRIARPPAATPLVRCTSSSCPLARQICLCRSRIHIGRLPSSPHGLFTLQITSISFSFSIISSLQSSPASQHISLQHLLHQSIRLILLLHQCIASPLKPRLPHLRSTTYTETPPLPPDLLTFLPARAPRPADLCLLCPNESRRHGKQTHIYTMATPLLG